MENYQDFLISRRCVMKLCQMWKAAIYINMSTNIYLFVERCKHDDSANLWSYICKFANIRSP